MSGQKTNSNAGDNNRFQSQEAYKGVNLECGKDKYTQILSIFVSNLSQEGSKECFQNIEGICHERSDCYQNQTASLQIKFRLGEAKWNWLAESSLLFTIFVTKYGEDSESLNQLSLG